MDHDDITDQDVIGQYRRGTLAADMVRSFEVHLIGCTRCQSLLATDAQLERGLQSIAARVAIDAMPPPRRALFGWRPPRRYTMAAAAVLALVVAVPWFARSWLLPDGDGEHIPLPEIAPRMAPQAGLPLFHLALTRGVDADAIELHVPAQVAWYALEIDAPVSVEECCVVLIEDANGTAIWRGETPVAPDTGAVRVLLSRSFLRTGSYRIALYAAADHDQRLVEHQVLVQLDH